MYFQKMVFGGRAISVDVPKDSIPPSGQGMIIPDIKVEKCCKDEVLEIKFSVFKPENDNI